MTRAALLPIVTRLLAVASWVLGPRRPAPRVPRRGRGHHTRRPPVTFVIWNLHATGGTVRTTLRQAGALADRGRDVTIVAVLCHRYQHATFFEVHPDVRVEVLVARNTLDHGRSPRALLRRWLDRRPPASTLFAHGRESQASLLTDVLLLGRLARTRGVVVGTRLGLNLAIARFAPAATVTVCQEHLQLRRYPDVLRRAIRRHLRHVDLVACLTEHDARDYRKLFRKGGPRIEVIPNAIPDAFPSPADGDATRLVSVGRLAAGKRFDRLIDAFARVAAERPHWDLRLVGQGPERAGLEARVAEHGLGDRVSFAGSVTDVDRELAAASVFVLSSSFESFGLVLLEAMAAGLAVVSTACPLGPRELIDDGRTGLLVPVRDVDALAARLAEVMDDAALRRRLAAAGRGDAERFTVGRVTDRWEQLLAELAAAA